MADRNFFAALSSVPATQGEGGGLFLGALSRLGEMGLPPPSLRGTVLLCFSLYKDTSPFLSSVSRRDMFLSSESKAPVNKVESVVWIDALTSAGVWLTLSEEFYISDQVL